jgi:Tfp pilus assembly protein PilN
MSKINLLPWRDEVKKLQNRIFVAFLVAAVTSAILIIIFIHMVISHKITNEQENISYLETQKTELKGKVLELLSLQDTKKMLLNQMRVIQILQGDRISMAKLLDILARYVTEGVAFTELTRKEVVVLPKETDAAKTHSHLVGNTVANKNASIDTANKKELENLYKQDQVEIIGIAQSNASITELLKNLENEKWFTDVQLSEVSRDKNGRDLNFKINLLHKIAEAE